jgi:hypothetical protein
LASIASCANKTVIVVPLSLESHRDLLWGRFGPTTFVETWAARVRHAVAHAPDQKKEFERRLVKSSGLHPTLFSFAVGLRELH